MLLERNKIKQLWSNFMGKNGKSESFSGWKRKLKKIQYVARDMQCETDKVFKGEGCVSNEFDRIPNCFDLTLILVWQYWLLLKLWNLERVQCWNCSDGWNTLLLSQAGNQQGPRICLEFLRIAHQTRLYGLYGYYTDYTDSTPDQTRLYGLYGLYG